MISYIQIFRRSIIQFSIGVALIACLNSNVATAAPHFQTKIVGGNDAIAGEFPFMVSVTYNGGHYCGGSLIASQWVLTAAHCVYSDKMSVTIGLHNLRDLSSTETINSAKIYVHPEYDSYTVDHDFALIRLETPSRFEPVSYDANLDQLLMDSEEKLELTTAGWGYTRESGRVFSDVLQKVNLPLVSNETCNESYGGDITENMLCAGYPEGGKDSCQGDSGGPLFLTDDDQKPVLVGVVSWGRGCAQAKYYGVYARVSSAVEWINSTMSATVAGVMAPAMLVR